MEKGLVTVVLPVYGTEKYLDTCISSVVSQTFSRLEILLIDDESFDNCPAICDEWVKKDNRIRVIHKKNEGLGMTRNTGIENATGEFICFFDSDDFIAPDTIEKTVALLTENNAEVVTFGFHTIDECGTILDSFVPDMDQTVYTQKEVQSIFLPELIAPDPAGDGKCRLYMSACMMLYSMELIRRTGWRFASERDIISEDVYSLLELFASVKCVAVCSESLYYYRTNQKSLSRKYKPDRYTMIRHFYIQSVELCNRLGYSDCVIERLTNPFLSFTRAAVKQEARSTISICRRIHNIDAILRDEVLQKVIRSDKQGKGTVGQQVISWAMKYRMTLLCFFMYQFKA